MPLPRQDQVITGWPGGVDNRRPQIEVPARNLREAVNVDLTDAGKIRRRRGYARIGDGGHSLFGDAHGILAIQGGSMRRWTSRTESSVVRTGFGIHRLSYTETALGTIWTNGIEIGLVRNATALEVWPAAPGRPALAAASGGALPEGIYQVALTWLDALGRESGATLAETVAVTAGSIAVWPIPAAAGATRFRIYLTGPNDEVLQRHSEHPVSTTSITITHPAEGDVLMTQFLDPLPPGQLVAQLNARTLLARGRFLHFTEPQLYGLTNYAVYVPFPGLIDMIAPIQNAGVFVGAGKRVYWLAGTNPDKWNAVAKHGHGVVRYSMTMARGELFGIDIERVPYWLGKDGKFMIGRPDGSIQPANANLLTKEGADEGASIEVERAGFTQIITAVLGGVHNRARAADVATATVYRHDT